MQIIARNTPKTKSGTIPGITFRPIEPQDIRLVEALTAAGYSIGQQFLRKPGGKFRWDTAPRVITRTLQHKRTAKTEQPRRENGA